jgi:hypothetical protein
MAERWLSLGMSTYLDTIILRYRELLQTVLGRRLELVTRRRFIYRYLFIWKFLYKLSFSLLRYLTEKKSKLGAVMTAVYQMNPPLDSSPRRGTFFVISLQFLGDHGTLLNIGVRVLLLSLLPFNPLIAWMSSWEFVSNTSSPVTHWISHCGYPYDFFPPLIFLLFVTLFLREVGYPNGNFNPWNGFTEQFQRWAPQPPT